MADAYREMTDSSRHLLRVRCNDPKEHRLKPDRETHPAAAFDYEEGVLRFSLFDLILLPPLGNEECPGIDLFDKAAVAKLV